MLLKKPCWSNYKIYFLGSSLHHQSLHFVLPVKRVDKEGGDEAGEEHDQRDDRHVGGLRQDGVLTMKNKYAFCF